MQKRKNTITNDNITQSALSVTKKLCWEYEEPNKKPMWPDHGTHGLLHYEIVYVTVYRCLLG